MTDKAAIEDDTKSSFLSKLELKDWLLVVPVLATSLAISYEIGSFVPTGLTAFSLFSLSDHLLWALQALPFAMAGVAAILVTSAFGAMVEKRRSSKPALVTPPKSPWRRHAGKAIYMVVLFGAFIVLKSVAGLVMFIALMFLWLVPKSPKRHSLYAASFGMFFSIAFVFALGIDVSRGNLNHTEPARFDLGDGNIRKLVLVRSGEHGMLLYDKQVPEFYFTRIDAVKTITWQRRPFRVLPP